MISKLLLDLASNSDLRNDLQTDPTAVMARYDLSDADRKLLTSGNPHLVKFEAIKEFIKLMEELAHLIVLGWSVGRVTLSGCTPATAECGKAVVLTATGSWFPPAAALAASLSSTAGTSMAASVTSVTGVGQNESTAALSVTFDDAGVYTLELTDTTDNSKSSLPNAVHVT